MESSPILKLSDYLLVSVQVDMHDRLAMALQDDLTDRIVKDRARGVLIDISSLDIVNSFIGRMLGSIAAIARVLDAETVVVGMQPAVAITLVEQGYRCRASAQRSISKKVWRCFRLRYQEGKTVAVPKSETLLRLQTISCACGNWRAMGHQMGLGLVDQTKACHCGQ